ncbi:hypothetical protein GWK47_051788 [Chionoecetes opilio]|uniref:Uncharacterized protein n=1 Tax=Chionoecetes opilio TaxID=41210 RepID=A0A8J4YCG1_CHIOP|nr:hypothetical protein GWK47_051788 [Chionoecetes opilio]
MLKGDIHCRKHYPGGSKPGPGNIDRLEETQSGAGTSHRVNGIAVLSGFGSGQKRSAKIPKVKIRSSLYRSISPKYTMLAGGGPPGLRCVFDNQEAQDKDKNHIWLFTRMSTMRTSTLWGRGSTSKSQRLAVVQDTVSTCPYQCPATEKSPVKEVWRKSMPSASLQLNKIVCVLINTLCQAAQVLGKKEVQEHFIRMGVSPQSAKPSPP